jgi:hypothetical protein
LKFGNYNYHGSFHVLKGDVPLILGMDFLVKVSPAIDWKNSKVTCYVGTKKFILPTCSIGNVDNITDANTFAGLEVDDVSDNSENELSRAVPISKNSTHVAPVFDA